MSYAGVRSDYSKLHRQQLEKIIGRTLPKGAEVHHRYDWKIFNVVICENHAYHHLIETRQEAYRKTGDATKRKCQYCGQFDVISNMKQTPGHNMKQMTYQHKECVSINNKRYRARRKGVS